MAKTTKTPRYTLTTEPAPAYWAGYLINGDGSSLSPEEITAADAWISNHGFPLDASDPYIGRHDGQICEMADYTVAALYPIK